MQFEEMLTLLIHRGASDVHLHAGLPVMARIGGELQNIGQSALTPEFVVSLADRLCTPQQQAMLRTYRQTDVAYSLPGLTRLRVNFFYQRNSLSAVMHVISRSDLDLSKVDLPPQALEHFASQKKGLILVTGPAGSGKSTTLARIVDEINQNHKRVIVTIEDPIEYLHTSKQSAVIQREIGSDALSFERALEGTTRQNADVIVIGEIRDQATAEAMFNAVHSGHLVLTSFNAPDSMLAFARLLEFFSGAERNISRVLFAEGLLGIINQRLLPAADGGRIAVIEVIRNNPRLREALKQPAQTGRLSEILLEVDQEGERTFDQHLLELHRAEKIDFQTARMHAQNPTRFELAILRQMEPDLSQGGIKRQEDWPDDDLINPTQM